jgi:hypothetical protein
MSHSGQLSEMRDDRSVWIVGDPEEGAKATTHRYHRGDCYVLDQVGNGGRTQKVALAELPEGYAPCQICAPGSRSSTATSGGAHLKGLRDRRASSPATWWMWCRHGARVYVPDRLLRPAARLRRDLARVAPRGRLDREGGASGC